MSQTSLLRIFSFFLRVVHVFCSKFIKLISSIQHEIKPLPHNSLYTLPKATYFGIITMSDHVSLHLYVCPFLWNASHPTFLDNLDKIFIECFPSCDLGHIFKILRFMTAFQKNRGFVSISCEHNSSRKLEEIFQYV